MSILGKTTTATLCNSHNLGNTIIVAAGDNGKGGNFNIDFSRAFNVSRMCKNPSFRGRHNSNCVSNCTSCGSSNGVRSAGSFCLGNGNSHSIT